ncbi:Inositol polyphosphate 5-phosphatase [Handroanthus impetiginosus]|uniref:Inositol polyphosphate 5-phosphatase n=1 Tax=Handroanthus impetiginosus TaxID=429701 RepID=A0A2G9HE81_9LAMI|nr:Inositol polyphosphate 5-phosphatase [Handroanthus impetiginosus]
MEGLRGVISLVCGKRGKRRMRGIPVGIMNNADASHEGIKTVKANHLCDFSNTSDLCICIVTWNMNGQACDEDMKKLVGNERKYDLLVIGLQEVPRSNVLESLEAALCESHVILGKAVMQSLQLYMFGSKNMELNIRELKVDKQGVGGCGGLIRRKKGAVAIRITYKGMHLVFISCHLSAHAHNVEGRNSECRHISHSLFSESWNPYAKRAQVTVWLGDLNYRLQGINTFPARNLIHQNLHGLLTTKDQLLQEAERGQVFNGYCEGTLAFKPTYKYDIGTSDYDTSHKIRVPAWTDRILYKVEDRRINATLHLYESIEGIYSSDHKPVKAHLCLKLNELS